MTLIDIDAIPESATTISTDGRLFVAWSEIVKAPVIEAEPVKYGQWIWKGRDKGYFCSVCNSGCLLNMESDWHTSTFCPNCGAKMGLKGR